MKFLKEVGPGIVVAATGVGAGDMIAASVAGASYGTVILWAALVGAVIKYVLNEGIARWQLATNTTVIQGWRLRFHGIVSLYFIVYLFLWGFIVAGALIAACGLAAHAIFPSLSVEVWGIIHSLVALLLVYAGRYQLVESLMKFLIGMMFAIVCISAVLVQPDWGEIIKSLILPRLPPGSIALILGVIGGVGGTVTLLSYGYWIREKNWTGRQFYKKARTDLAVAYFLTGLFGAAIMVIAAGVKPGVITGNQMVIGLAEQMGKVVGPMGKWIFLIGFWGAVFSSMLGVWQGVPYLFSDCVRVYKNRSVTISETRIDVRSGNYLFFLFYMAIPPLLLLFFGKPVWIVVIYSIIGAFFMPFLAVLLLIMNNKIRWVKDLKNSLLINFLLLAGVVLFALLCIREIWLRLF
jgi:Mn2+/Fe2+ NRAMP family transporter